MTEILAPYGVPLDERPPLMSEEDRVAKKMEKRGEKLERRKMRREGMLGEELEAGDEDGESKEDIHKERERSEGRMNMKAIRNAEKARENEAEVERLETELDGRRPEDVDHKVKGTRL